AGRGAPVRARTVRGAGVTPVPAGRRAPAPEARAARPATRVLGIDPGSRRTGFGVVERSGNAFRALDHGTPAPPARLGLARRLLALRAAPAPDAADALAGALTHLHRARRVEPARALSAAARGLEALLARKASR